MGWEEFGNKNGMNIIGMIMVVLMSYDCAVILVESLPRGKDRNSGKIGLLLLIILYYGFFCISLGGKRYLPSHVVDMDYILVLNAMIGTGINGWQKPNFKVMSLSGRRSHSNV